MVSIDVINAEAVALCIGSRDSKQKLVSTGDLTFSRTDKHRRPKQDRGEKVKDQDRIAIRTGSDTLGTERQWPPASTWGAGGGKGGRPRSSQQQWAGGKATGRATYGRRRQRSCQAEQAGFVRAGRGRRRERRGIWVGPDKEVPVLLGKSIYTSNPSVYRIT